MDGTFVFSTSLYDLQFTVEDLIIVVARYGTTIEITYGRTIDNSSGIVYLESTVE
jgi:hypothetical protein